MAHASVLLQEAIDGLDLKEGDVYLDATLGSGGHLEEVWRRTKGKVLLSGIDADSMSVEITKERLDLLGAKPKLLVLNFKNIDKAPELLDLPKPSKILFDLGWSSDQFFGNGSDAAVGAGRGFSFQKDEPLIMTLSQEISQDGFNAYDVVNKWQEENLADVIYGFGEERYARRIAKAIVKERKKGEIKTSKQLAEIVKEAVPFFYRFGRLHPATRTFQAIRIAVNDELRALEDGLSKAFEILETGGRLAVISFHSLEDRIVKNFFKSKAMALEAEMINKKPITPSEAEISRNPRSRSAKLRIIKKIK